MIGLGSNKMSVCRRGGMRVTQAGRGGMEWLAGGRLPSWASPYSAQATAALKAQFPTQWPTIRDYGFAHPEYIAAINFAAPQDPEIMYSLIPELGKTRWLVSNSTEPCLIDTHIVPTLDDKILFSFKHQGNECILMQSLIGNWNDANPNNHWIALKSSGSTNKVIDVWMFSAYTNVFTLNYAFSTYRADFVFDIKNRTVTGTVNGSTKTYTNVPRYSPSPSQPSIKIGHSGSNAHTEIFNYEHYRNGELIGLIIPCKRSDNTVGGINMLTAEFCEVTRGSFTISETPAS